jgi:glycerol-3-phosphate dehydrogenase
VVTRCRAAEVLREPLDSEQDRVVGVRVAVDGEQFDVHARCVLSATGVWTDEFREIAGVGREGSHVRQAKGVHLIVPRDRIKCGTAVIARTETSVLFLLPWGGDCWLIGTTDTDYDGDLADPRAQDEDVDYLLDQASRWLADPLTRDDIIGVYCGLRPLVANEVMAEDDEATAELSREHVVLRPLPGLVMIAGGKYTTYRVMAADAVDAAVAERAAFVAGEPPESRTQDVPVVGAEGFADLWQSRSRLAREWGTSEEAVVHLLRRHGDRSGDVAALIAEDPALGERLHPEAPYLRAEAVVAVRDEAARTIEDVLVRRTRIALETRDVGRVAVSDTADIMGAELGWSEQERDAQIERFCSDWPDSWQSLTAERG